MVKNAIQRDQIVSFVFDLVGEEFSCEADPRPELPRASAHM